MIYLILLTIYLLSVYAVYKWVQIAFYNKKGIFKTQKEDVGQKEMFWTFMPIANTVFAIMVWLIAYPFESTKSINFFKPKNYDKNP